MPDEMEPVAREASELLTAMANEKRLLILCQLLKGEMSVNVLAEKVGMNQSALSQQLSKLRALKLVDTRREAQQIYYRLTSIPARQLLETLYGIFCVREEKS